MKAVPTEESAMITSAHPQLFVRDIDAACDHYVRHLGFQVVFKWGEPPYYAQVRRDAARLDLRCVVPPLIDRARVHREQLLSATLALQDADELRALHDELVASGASIVQPPQVMPWGAINVIVEDLDGNLLLLNAPGGGDASA